MLFFGANVLKWPAVSALRKHGQNFGPAVSALRKHGQNFGPAGSALRKHGQNFGPAVSALRKHGQNFGPGCFKRVYFYAVLMKNDIFRARLLQKGVFLSSFDEK